MPANGVRAGMQPIDMPEHRLLPDAYIKSAGKNVLVPEDQ
jgi:hypothetical protein